MKAVLFDLDNTLLMKRPSIPEKWYEVLVNAGFDVNRQATQRAFAECEMWVGAQIDRENKSGIRLSDEEFKEKLMLCCTDSLGIGREAFGILAPIWIGKYDMQYEIAEGALSLFDYLRGKGILLGIVSNNRSSIRKTLEDFDMLKYFDTVVISEEVGLYKPDPRILHYACDKLNVEAEETLFVGDHPYDVVCANDASVNAAWIPVNEFMMLPEGVREPLFKLKTLDELMSCI